MGFETFRDKNKIITEANCKREISVFEFIDSLLKIIHNQIINYAAVVVQHAAV